MALYFASAFTVFHQNGERLFANLNSLCTHLHGLPDCVAPSRTRPWAGCLPARPAIAGRTPSGYAAGAPPTRFGWRSAAPPKRFGRPSAPLIVSLPHRFSPSGMERGMHMAASAAPVLAIPPPIPTQAYRRDSLPSHGRSAASAFGASGSSASVSRPIPDPMHSIRGRCEQDAWLRTDQPSAPCTLPVD